jgi:hypothetical protein
MFKIGDKVVVTLQADAVVEGAVIRITQTEAGIFYGVRLKNGHPIHGLDGRCLEVKTSAA